MRWCAVFFLACAPILDIPPTASIMCEEDSDCPSGWSCVESRGFCARAGQACLAGEGPTLAPLPNCALGECTLCSTDDGARGICEDGWCVTSRCGDGILDDTLGKELCDDGPQNTDRPQAQDVVCRTDCTVSRCGDGIRDLTEQCDDGNDVTTDLCSNECTSSCGDGEPQPGEGCDDGNLHIDDACPSGPAGLCQPARCGDGFVFVGVEVCDDGNGIDGDGCDNNCGITGCGNGAITGDEACDDGNVISGDGCDANCRVTGCGNGIRSLGEECDDGNLNNGDGCVYTASGECKLARCGDGFVREDILAAELPGFEACDDGNGHNLDACPDGVGGSCRPARCGDGFVRADLFDLGDPATETCDDGDGSNVDECPDGEGGTCRPARCGDGFLGPGELCDDGNHELLDACPDGALGTCEPARCGDGLVRADITDDQSPAFEGCDDGNDLLNDDCPSGAATVSNPILCRAAVCGDGYVDQYGPQQEACDWLDAPLDACTEQCRLPSCGDGNIQAGETCDDNNDVTNDDCPSGPVGSCQPASCGDGFRDEQGPMVEACDAAENGCDPNCTFPRCGNGFVALDEGGNQELCDDGNLTATDACPSGAAGRCKPATCGDGFLRMDLSPGTPGYEACDQGGSNSNAPNAACRTSCLLGRCGDGITDPAPAARAAEACDDGNAVNDDYCRNDCTVGGSCGDGVLQSVEICDNGGGAGCTSCTAVPDNYGCDGDGAGSCFTTVYIDKNVVGGDGSGRNWQNAKKKIPTTASGKYFVASGTYVVGVDTESAVVNLTGSLYGGFAGERQAELRSVYTAKTIITGDTLGDDAGGFNNRADNVGNFIVMTGSSALLDGFDLRSGTSSGSNPGAVTQSGGTIRNCAMSLNRALSGGALRMVGPVTVEKTTFTNNKATSYGGAVFVYLATSTQTAHIDDCTFSNNTSDFDGGAIAAQGQQGTSPPAAGKLTVLRGRFTNNTATSEGGAIAVDGSAQQTQVEDSLFVDNAAPTTGSVIKSSNPPGSSTTTVVLYGVTIVPLSGRTDSVDVGAGQLTVRSSIVTGSARQLTAINVTLSYNRVGSGQDRCNNNCITSGAQLDAQYVPSLGSPVIDAGYARNNKDLLGKPRVDQPSVTNTGAGSNAYTDMGALERQ